MVVGGWAGNGNPGEAVWWCIHPAVCGTRAGGDLSLHGWHGALHTETGRRCESLICLCHACVVPFMQNWSLTWVMHCLCHACMVPFIQNWSLTWVTHCLCQACMVPVIQNWSLTCVSHCLCHACMVPFIHKLNTDMCQSLSLSCLHGALHTKTGQWSESLIFLCHVSLQKLVSDLNHSFAFLAPETMRLWNTSIDFPHPSPILSFCLSFCVS